MQELLRRLFDPRLYTLPVRRLLPGFNWKRLITLNGTFNIVCISSALAIYDELYKKEIYKNLRLPREPIILDLGANIGMVTCHLAQRFKDAEIISFEPDSNIFSVLNRNVKGLSNVKTVNKAVSSKSGTAFFSADGAAGGTIDEFGKDLIEIVSISDIINEKGRVNLVKIDIEGHEYELFRNPDWLNNVDNLFIELHSESENFQDVFVIIEILVQYGFKVELESEVPLGWGSQCRDKFTGQFLVQAYGKS